MIDPNGSILDQLEALRGVILRSLAGVAVMVIPCFFFAPYCLKYMIKVTCPEGVKLHYFTPLEPFLVQLQMGLFLGIAAASWWVFYQVGAFIAPGLYKHERSAVIKFVLSSAALFFGGGAFAFYVVLPLVMKFSYSFASSELSPVIGVGDFLSMMTMIMLGFAGSFQFPVVLVLLARIGIVKPETLSKQRPVVITVIFIVAAFLTPPDVISQLAMAVPAWLLFEITLLIIKRKHKAVDVENTEPEENTSSAECRKTADVSVSAEKKRPQRQRRIRPL